MSFPLTGVGEEFLSSLGGERRRTGRHSGPVRLEPELANVGNRQIPDLRIDVV